MAFNLSLLGTEVVSGKKAWVIAAEPKPGYKPSQDRAKVLTKIRAKIWVDQAEYQWVKVDAEAVEPISFGFGLFRIAQGGKLHFEQMRINDEVWLPSLLSASADARVGYVKKVRGDINVTYRDYRKFPELTRELSPPTIIRATTSATANPFHTQLITIFVYTYTVSGKVPVLRSRKFIGQGVGNHEDCTNIHFCGFVSRFCTSTARRSDERRIHYRHRSGSTRCSNP